MPWYKKLFFILTTIPIVVWITIKFVFFKASAAMVAPSVLSGLALILAGLLASSGATINTNNGSYTGSAIYDLPPATIQSAFSEFVRSDEGKFILTSQGILTKEIINQLSDYVNNQITNSAAGALDVSTTVLDWIKEHQDSVKTETVGDGSFDMRGYGAALYIADKSGHKYEVTFMNYGILTPNSDYYNCYTNGASLEIICSYSDKITERTIPNDFSIKYTSKCILYGDWRYADGTPATDIAISPTTEQPLPIGGVTIDGVEYPINPDGSVTIDGVDYYPTSEGKYSIPSITNEGDTIYNSYSPTYNISNYDDSAVIDLLTQLSAKMDTLYPQPEEPVIEDVTVNLNNVLNAIKPMVEIIPYNGWNSVFSVIQSAVFVKSKPKDIVLSFKTSVSDNEVGGDFVLIPASIIDDWHGAIITIKILVSVILLYFWLRYALRVILSMIN